MDARTAARRALAGALLPLLHATAALAQTPAPETAATRPLEAPPPPPPPGAPQPVSGSVSLGRGVTFRSEDERYALTIRGRIQARFTLAEQPEAPQTEFQIRRMRLELMGNVFSRDLQYYVHLGFAGADNEPDLRLPLRDAYFTWTALRDLNVRAGQMKVPFGRQRVASSSALQFVDRANAVAEFNLDRDVGVSLRSGDLFGLGGRLAYQLGVFNGDGRNRLSETEGLLWVARLQVAPFGEYDDLVEGDLARLATPRLALGGAVAYNQNTRRARSTFGDSYQRGFDYVHANVDLAFKWRGFSLQAEWLYRRAGEDSHELTGGTTPTREYSRSGWGYYVQAGLFLTRRMELAARWGEIHPSDGTDPNLRRNRELGGALSWYFQRHDLKLQADYFYLAGEDFSDGRHQARLQAQVYF